MRIVVLVVLLAACTQSLPTSQGILDECGGDVECVLTILDGVLADEGQEAAFALLVELTADPRLAAEDHAMAHHLGHRAYEMEGTAALSGCPPGMGSGCMHGVLEAYLLDNGKDAPIAGLCAFSGPAALHRQHQCYHGIGHGLMMSHGYDWSQASAQCTSVEEFEDEIACHGGVFMENYVGSPAGMEALHGAAWPEPDIDRFRPDDHLYPCNQLELLEAGIGCWQYQPFWIYRFTQQLTPGFEACAQAGVYAYACERAMGRVGVAVMRLGGEDPVDTCRLAANTSAMRHCVMGAVMEWMTLAGEVGPGLDMCDRVQAEVEEACWTAVGQMHVSLESRRVVREVTCEVAPEAYRAHCIG